MKKHLEHAAAQARQTEFNLRAAYTDAVAVKNEFAQIILLVMISEAAQLAIRCERMLDAARDGGK